MTTIAFDTETKGLDWWDPSQQAFLASWADADSEYVADLSDPAQAATFIAALEDADTLVAHNLSFDAHQVMATLGHDITANGHTLHDTDLMSRVLYPQGQRTAFGAHRLKNLAKVHLRADAQEAEATIEELAKQIGLRTLKQTGAYFDVWRAYPAELEYYAKQDARYTYDLYTKFSDKLGETSAIYDLERELAPALIRAEARGLQTDQAACQRLKELYSARRDQSYDYLIEHLGEEALGGTGSEEALVEALIALGVPLHRKTDTGKLSTNQYALQEFEDDYEVLGELMEYRRLTKFLSTYIGALDGVDVVHPGFNQCAAWTGRMSCSRPNMQNIPKRAGKEVRSILVPREGHSFVVCDYDSIEVRLLAYYLADPGFQQLIEEGHDPHAWMAAHIYGGAMEDYEKDGPGDAQRSVAKNTLFAIVYGAGAPRVADMNKIPVPEARALISKIKAALPNYKRLSSRVRNKIQTVGYVTTIYGRKQVVPREKGYVGLNALIQGSAADIFKRSVLLVEAAVKPLGGAPVLFVHDEIVVEVPTTHEAEALTLVQAAMESAAELTPSLKVTGCCVQTSYADA